MMIKHIHYSHRTTDWIKISLSHQSLYQPFFQPPVMTIAPTIPLRTISPNHTPKNHFPKQHPIWSLEFNKSIRQDEIDRASHADIFTIVLSYILMFLYVGITLGDIDCSFKGCLLNSKVGIYHLHYYWILTICLVIQPRSCKNVYL